MAWFELTEPTAKSGKTVMVTSLDDAGFPAEQSTLEVTIHAMIFPFTGTKEYVALVAPVTGVPLTFH